MGSDLLALPIGRASQRYAFTRQRNCAVSLMLCVSCWAIAWMACSVRSDCRLMMSDCACNSSSSVRTWPSSARSSAPPCSRPWLSSSCLAVNVAVAFSNWSAPTLRRRAICCPNGKMVSGEAARLTAKSPRCLSRPIAESLSPTKIKSTEMNGGKLCWCSATAWLLDHDLAQGGRLQHVAAGAERAVVDHQQHQAGGDRGREDQHPGRGGRRPVDVHHAERQQ